MASSILTNNGAMVALQSLQMTQKALQDTQNRISTGMKVSSAKDNAATWAVATSMRADIANYKQVSENLSVSSGVVGTAAAGTEQIASLISSIRTAVTSVQDGVKDAKTVQASIDASLGQIKSIVDSSAFKGVNLLDGSKTGDTQILASVNSAGGTQTPSYITVGATNLTMAQGGSLASLKGFSVDSVVSKYAYSQPTDTSGNTTAEMSIGDTVTFSFKVNGNAKTATFTAAAALDMGNVEDVKTFMNGMVSAINTAAGAANQIASLDVSGRLVVDASKASDAVTFNGATALSKGTDTNTAITLGTATDLNPATQKFTFAKPTGSATAGNVFDFSFKVDGVDTVASYTVPSGGTYSDVMTNLVSNINSRAGTGNTIASLDAGGNLVVDAGLANSKITFEGAAALKKQSTSLTTSVAMKSTYAAATPTTALGTAAVTGDTVSLNLTVNGATVAVSRTVDQLIAGSARGGAALADYAATAAGGDALISDLATYINTLGYGNIASNSGSGATSNLSINAANATLGYDVSGMSAISTSGTVTITGGATIGVATANVNTTVQQTYNYSGTAVAGDTFKYTFTQGGVSKSAEVTMGANTTKAEMLRSLASAINTAAGGAIAAVDGDVGSEKLYVDGSRASSAVTLGGVTGDLTNVHHASTNATTATQQTSTVDTSYTGLLASLNLAQNAVLSAGAAFGSAQTRVDSQKTFIDKLSDTLTAGVGSLVDADMSAEAARLQALQVQQQLGTQALSIANQAPQSILSLFK